MFYYVNVYSQNGGWDRHMRCRTHNQALALIASMRALWPDLQAWVNDLPA
jgi:hypothetical protein